MVITATIIITMPTTTTTIITTGRTATAGRSRTELGRACPLRSLRDGRLERGSDAEARRRQHLGRRAPATRTEGRDRAAREPRDPPGRRRGVARAVHRK